MSITLIGTVSMSPSWAVLTPDSGQGVSADLPLMMTYLPKNGSTQDHIDAAISYFTGKTGRYSLTGTVRPLVPTRMFSVDSADPQ